MRDWHPGQGTCGDGDEGCRVVEVVCISRVGLLRAPACRVEGFLRGTACMTSIALLCRLCGSSEGLAKN